MRIERRYYEAELRVEGEGDARQIVGYAAVFNQLSLPLGWAKTFRERIRPGAFAKTIGEADIRALFNHDPNYVLGRNKAGTLRLAEDDRGLRIEIDPPAAQWARDLMVSIGRGDVNQMSFGFETVRDAWAIDEDGNQERELVEVRLWDAGPVTFPAYPQTDAQLRALMNYPDAPAEDGHPSGNRTGDGLTQSDGRPETGEWAAASQARIKLLRRKLELIEIAG